MENQIDELCVKCPILSICKKNDCVNICDNCSRCQREMIRDASFTHEQANGADYGNI